MDGKHQVREIREGLLKRQRHLNPDDYFDNLSFSDLKVRLLDLGEYNGEERAAMIIKLKIVERTRNIQIWHDGSTIANHFHILFTANIVYDSAVFKTALQFGTMQI